MVVLSPRSQGPGRSNSIQIHMSISFVLAMFVMPAVIIAVAVVLALRAGRDNDTGAGGKV